MAAHSNPCPGCVSSAPCSSAGTLRAVFEDDSSGIVWAVLGTDGTALAYGHAPTLRSAKADAAWMVDFLAELSRLEGSPL